MVFRAKSDFEAELYTQGHAVAKHRAWRAAKTVACAHHALGLCIRYGIGFSWASRQVTANEDREIMHLNVAPVIGARQI